MDEDIVHAIMKIMDNVRECDVLLALHKHAELGLTQMKYILARISHTDETYFFPECDLGKAKFGPAVEWDETLAKQVALKTGSYKEAKKDVEFIVEEDAWY